MKKKPIWVIKLGSQSIIDGGKRLISQLTQSMIPLRQKYSIVWVSSGAIAQAKVEKKLSRIGLSDKQALSAVGQPIMYRLYEECLNKKGISTAQILLSSSDLRMKIQRANFLATAAKLLSWDCIPVINENDAVATEEIKFGDNDNLAAIIAIEMGAKRLTLLSNVDGLLDKDKQLVKDISRIQRKHFDWVDSKKSASGSGGMLSKLMASQKASKKGIEVDIVNASTKNIFQLIEDGPHPGTKIRIE